MFHLLYQPDNPAFVMTGISGLLLILLILMYLLTQYIQDRMRDECEQIDTVTDENNGREGHPVAASVISIENRAFTNEQNVAAIRDFADQEFYAVLLTALDQALQKYGYEMTRDKSRETVLPLVVECGVIRDVSAARVGYITPRLSEEAKKKSIQGYIDDGYGDCFVMLLLEGAKAQGWYMARMHDEQGETVCDL